MPRPREGDVKQALHLLSTEQAVGFLDLRFAVLLVQRRDDFVAAWHANQRRITRRRLDNSPAEKWNNDSIPFQTFRLVRGDELDRVLIRETDGARVLDFVAQAFGEVGKARTACSSLSRVGQKRLEIGEGVFEVFGWQ